MYGKRYACTDGPTFPVGDIMIGENAINDRLADILDGMNTGWRVAGEDYGRFRGDQTRPDILVEGNFQPIGIETEFEPAGTLEVDALSRLGKILRDSGKTVDAVFAVKLPEHLRNRRKDLTDIIKSAEFKFAVYAAHRRFPTEGWIHGNYRDLCEYVRARTTINRKIEQYAESVYEAILAITKDITKLAPKYLESISKSLQQEQGDQTWRMAGLVLANAVIFYEAISGHHDIPRLDPDDFKRRNVLGAWKSVLRVNYKPIFTIARDILRNMDNKTAKTVLTTLSEVSDDLHTEGLESSPDLAGALIQRTISDRKRLAAFYTLPPTAVMLAALLVPRDCGTWKDDWQEKFRVGDFACGTGTLLAAVYRQIIVNNEACGSQVRPHHGAIMEKVLVGRDVLPVSVHLAVATLSSVYVHDIINETNILSMPFGSTDTADSDKTYSLGSLDLMDNEMATLAPSLSIMVGGQDIKNKDAGAARETFNIVVMNPPFVRSTNHAGDGRDKDHAPAFAAFGANEEDQRAMASKAAVLLKNTCYSGNAGLGSAFAAIGDRMLAPNGMLGIILPATVTTGESWSRLRNILNRHYQDVVVFTLADIASSFSADTNMGEAIIVCRKRKDVAEIRLIEKKIKSLEARLKRQIKKDKPSAIINATAASIETERRKLPDSRGMFVTLQTSPSNVLEAIAFASTVRDAHVARPLESEAYGATSLTVGGDIVGYMLDCPLNRYAWAYGNVKDMTLLQVVEQLRQGNLQLRSGAPHPINMARLKDVADPGLVDRDIIEGSGKDARGPFKRVQKSTDYPALWNNNLDEQDMMMVKEDCYLEAKARVDDKRVIDAWSKAGHLHINREVTYHAQKVCLAYTNNETMGGRAWPNLLLHDTTHEKALCVWGNSTLGILCYWGTAGRQQPGRGVHSRSSVMDMPVLDMTALSSTQLAEMDRIFDKYCKKRMKSIALLDRCRVRHQMDAELMAVLDIGDIDLSNIRKRLCDEPSMHGGRTIDREIPEEENMLYKVRQLKKGTTVFVTEKRVLIQDGEDTQSIPYDQITNVSLDMDDASGGKGHTQMHLDGSPMLESAGKATATSTLTFAVSGLGGGPEANTITIDNLPKSRLTGRTKRQNRRGKASQPNIDVLYTFIRKKCGLPDG